MLNLYFCNNYHLKFLHYLFNQSSHNNQNNRDDVQECIWLFVILVFLPAFICFTITIIHLLFYLHYFQNFNENEKGIFLIYFHVVCYIWWILEFMYLYFLNGYQRQQSRIHVNHTINVV